MTSQGGGGWDGVGGQASADPGDGAVSDIVGNILMVGVTVLLAGALALSLSAATAPADPVSADLVVVDGPDLEVRHAGGEPVPVDGPRFVLTVDGAEEVHPLSEFSGDVSGGSENAWEIGERVCLSCQVGGNIEAVVFVAAEQVILDWERNP